MRLRSLTCASVVVALLAAGCASRASAPRPAARGRAQLDLGRLDAERPDGTPVPLTGPGPARLVELWATWCAPCARAAAAARPVLARHPRVVAYAVSIDGDATTVEGHAAKAAGEILVVRGGAASSARAGVDRLPTFVALDARGRVVGTVTGAGPSLGATLERLLGHAEGRVGERD